MNLQRLLNFGLSFLLIFGLAVSPMTAVSATENKDTTVNLEISVKEYAELIQTAIDLASANIIESGVHSEWEAIGLTQAGKTVPATYTDTFKQNIEDQITKGLENGRFKITDSERLAMAAVAIGKDPRDVYGHNLIELIYNSPDRELWDGSVEDTLTYQGNNGIIFALTALDTKEFSIPEDAKWTREKLVTELVGNQIDNGAWSLTSSSTGAASFDITAMALIGLAPYSSDPVVKEAVNKAVSFLSERQGDTGGFNDPWNGGVSVETTAQVIIGLTANHIDPLGELFTKNGINLVDHLLSFQAKDGGFKHLVDDTRSNGMATEQALQALVAYEFYLNGKGSLYDFSDKVVEPEPNPEPEDPEVDPTPEVEKIIQVGDVVEVEKGQTISIEGSNTSLLLPNDLPEGTTLKVTTPTKEKTPYKGLTLAGDWFDFNIQYAEGARKGTESYQLSLGVNDGIDNSKTGVYYFNEQSKQWQNKAGWGNAKEGVITIDVDHFSTYGVFTDVEGPTNVQISEKEITAEHILLSLSANDPSGIKEYKISRGGEEVAVLVGTETEFSDIQLTPNQLYEYTIIAVDHVGNESESVKLVITTLPDNKKRELETNDDEKDPVQKVEKETPESKSPIVNKETVSKGNDKLPKTATSTFTYLLVGMILLSVGGITMFFRRKTV